MSLSVIWGIISLIFVILEIVSVIFFPIFFAIGAFVTSMYSFFSDSWVEQVLVFAVVSVVSTFIGKPILQKYFRINEEIASSTVNALYGKSGIVTSPIEAYKTGQVKVDGAIWTALSEDGENIEKGIPVTVIRIEGVKLIVEKSV